MPEPRCPAARAVSVPLILALAIGTVSAFSAAAQEAAPLDRCLEASATRAGDLACRDVVYGACQDRGDDSTAGMAQCLAEEQALWDAWLNALWPEIRALAAARGDPEAAAQEALVEAQQRWIAFRDAECGWEFRRQGGSIRLILVAACMRDMTAERVADFRDWLRDADPQ